MAPDAIVARLGGDEFGILLPPGCDSDVALESAAGRISRALAEPFALDELSLTVAASIGAARFPDDGADANALLRCADVAMYAAKDAQAEYKLYAVEQNRHSLRRLSVLSDFRRALEDGGLAVYYQPIMALADRSIRGAEALVRWQHPERGLLMPGDFISTVEQTDLVGPLSRYVLEHAIAACAGWRRQGHQMSVAVNLSARNLLDRGLPDDVARMLDAAGVPADALSLEITERMIMADPERAIANILRMSSLGMRLSVDDFGTGYFSLANLRRLPINDLKIDSSFVFPMLHSESDLIIVRSTINLGYDLGLADHRRRRRGRRDARAPGVVGLRSRPGIPHRCADGRHRVRRLVVAQRRRRRGGRLEQGLLTGGGRLVAIASRRRPGTPDRRCGRR